jgi:hypothetical protein
MKLLHRLLASAGLAAFIAPQPVDAALTDRPARDPAHSGLSDALPGAAQGLEPAAIDAAIAQALGSRRSDPESMAAALPGIVARVVGTAPAGVRPEQIAAQLARRVGAALPGLDIAARANLASDIVAGVLQALAARGQAVDRVAVASAALAGISGAAGAPGTPLGAYTASTRTAARDVSDHDSGRNTAY